MTIFFDLDGTLANLYEVDGWLDYLRAYDPTPYTRAAVMHNMSLLARRLNQLQAAGYELGVISWLSKVSCKEYDKAVTIAKIAWLKKHLHSVHFNHINIVEYGTPKANFMTSENDILFDDEKANRENWGGEAFEPQDILEVLTELLKGE